MSPPAKECLVLNLGPTEYAAAWDIQRRVAAAVRDGQPHTLILLEHPPTYTLGARGREEHLLVPEGTLAAMGAAVHRVDRGGDVTFHGPGQLVAYPIFRLGDLGDGPRWYVRRLEDVLIETLAAFDVEAARVDGRPGVWSGGRKIAAIGVRISRGVTSHGFALNVDPDLSYFERIVPCGIAGAGVTSMAQVLGAAPPMTAVREAAVAAFARVFGLRPHAATFDEALVSAVAPARI